MSYVLTDGASTVVTYPYSIGLLRRDNPNVSFPASPTNEQLAEWHVYPVKSVDQPAYNRIEYSLTELDPLLLEGGWTQNWALVENSPEVQAELTAQFVFSANSQAQILINQANQIIVQAIIDDSGLTEEFNSYYQSLSAPELFPGYPSETVFPELPTNVFDSEGSFAIDTYRRHEIDEMLLNYYTKAETDQRIQDIIGLAPAALDTISELAAALGNDANFSTTVLNALESKLEAEDLSAVALSGSYNDLTDKPTMTGLVNKVLNIEPPLGSSVANDPLIANALTTINSTNGYTINLGFGEYRETGPIVFDNKWQLQVVGPQAGGTTAATIKNGITIQNSNGVRLTNVQVESTSSISSRAGLGMYFRNSQFMGALTLNGTGGFMMFTDCEFGNNVTVPSTFAGVIYFIRCNFAASAGVYTLNQPSAQQVIMVDCTGIPNAGLAKASFSGSTVYKNGSQAQFINNVAITTLGGTTGQVLKFNGTAWAPAADNATDATKVPLAGGTMTGALTLSGPPSEDNHAATKKYVDSAFDTSTLIAKSGDTMTGALVFDEGLGLGSITVDPATSAVTINGGIEESLEVNYQGLFVTGNGLSTSMSPGQITLNGPEGPAIPTEPNQVATKAYTDALAQNASDSLVHKTGSTMLGELDMGFNKIVGLADPEFPQDAAHKQYVDTAISNAGFNGGTITENLRVEGGTEGSYIELQTGSSWVVASDAEGINQAYVGPGFLSVVTSQGAVSLYEGQLGAFASDMTSPQIPVEPYHLATKQYVDIAIDAAHGGGGGGGSHAWQNLAGSVVSANSTTNVTYSSNISEILETYSELMIVSRRGNNVLFSGTYSTSVFSPGANSWEIAAIGSTNQNAFISYNSAFGANVLRFTNSSGSENVSIFLLAR